jgi:DNA-directed RNA polymerase specialized sigma24 family protein
VSRDAARRDFEEFVAVCCGRLLRTAYLLTGDEPAAEALLDDALARAWLSWNRLDEPPEPYVRRLLVTRAHGGRPGRVRPSDGRPGGVRPGGPPSGLAGDDGAGADETWARLQRLAPRQRAVVVLHWYEGLSLDEAGELLGCSSSAAHALAAKALEHLGISAAPRPREPHGAP